MAPLHVLAAGGRVAAQVAKVAGALQRHGAPGIEDHRIGRLAYAFLRLGQGWASQAQQDKKLFHAEKQLIRREVKREERHAARGLAWRSAQ
jgi:hypothetical protein